jgi:hypothetical protein
MKMTGAHLAKPRTVEIGTGPVPPQVTEQKAAA